MRSGVGSKDGGAGRERCLQWDLGHIIPSLRKQLTFENGKTEHDSEAARGMLTEVVPKNDGTDWAQMRIIASFFPSNSRGKAPGQSARRVEKHQKSSRVSRLECRVPTRSAESVASAQCLWGCQRCQGH